jgi:hypothetical protein
MQISELRWQDCNRVWEMSQVLVSPCQQQCRVFRHRTDGVCFVAACTGGWIVGDTDPFTIAILLTEYQEHHRARTRDHA